MTDWKDSDEPERAERPLNRTKLPCGCWSYFQDCGDYAVYSLLVKHACQKDHLITVDFKDGPPTTDPQQLVITQEIGTRITEEVIHTPETPQLGGTRNN